MTRLLHPTAAIILCVLFSVIGIHAEKTPLACIDEWDEGAYPPATMAFLTVSCPANVLLSLPSDMCTILVDIPEPTSNCEIISIENDFNMSTSIPEQTFGPTNLTITWTVTDCDGTFTCTQFVIIQDDTAPTLVCPPSDMQECTVDDMIPFANIAELVAAGAIVEDNCQLDSTFLEVGPLVLEDEGPCPSIYTRSYTVRDTSDNMTTCMQTILVEDMTAPTFTCPASITVSTDDDMCSATITVPDLVDITDNCGIDTIYNSLTGADNMITLPIGDQEITYYAVDSCGNIDSCETLITVLDATSPIIMCPADLTASCDVSEQAPYADFAAFMMAGGSATDNCAIDENTFEIVDQSSNGAVCPEIITRRYRIADTSSNYDTCTQLIVIEEDIAPTFTVPADITVDCGTNIDDLTVVGNVTGIDDNCGAGMVSVDYTDSFMTGTCPNLFVVTRSWVAVDSCGNNSVTQDQLISIQDTMSPMAVCQDAIIYLDASGEAFLDPSDIDAGSSDGCGSGAVSLSADFSGGTCNDAPMPINVTLTVTDACGNTDECMATVMIQDTLHVTLTCPPVMFVDCPTDVPAPYANGTLGYEEFEDDGGFFDDNCQAGQPSVFTYLGETQTGTDCPYNILRTYTAEDAVGNADTCVRVITVNDSVLPSLTCPNDTTIVDMMGVCDTMLTLPLLIATDACGIQSITNDYTAGGADASGIYPGGVTIVTFTVTDNCGNSATCAFNVTVQADPTFMCVADTILQCDLSDYPPYEHFADFMADGGSANAGCGIDTSTFTLDSDIITSSDACSEVHERTYSIMSAGETYMCTQVVSTIDSELPTITCADNINLNAEIDMCSANITLPPPTTTDNCGILSITNDYTTEASADFLVGLTTVTYTVTDNCGNTATCSMEVLISDAQSPEITCPEPETAMCDGSMVPTYMTLPEFIDGGGSVSDNCMLDSTSFMFVQEDTLMIFGMTMINRLYTIQDTVGNSGTCTQTILLLDSTEPFVSCPDDVELDADPGLCTADVNGLIASFDDNCLVDTIYNSYTGDGADASGTYPVGETVVIFTVEDEEGNSSTCSFTVTINDVLPPTITCPPSESAMCSIDQVPAYATWQAFIDAGGSATDICGIDTTTFILTSETSTGADPIVYTRTYTISDINGNENSCQQDVTIQDTGNPMITCPADVIVSSDASDCNAFVILSVTAEDFCQVDTIYNDYTDNGANADADYPVGVTIVTFTAEDGAGNTATCSVSVTVNDETIPLITCPSTITTQCDIDDLPPYTSYMQFEMAGGDATDNCALDTMSFMLVSQVQTSTDPLTFERTYSIDDIYENTATCVQTVVIDDTEEPIITCPGNVTVSTDAGECTGTVTSLMATANDNCVVVTITNDYNAGGAEAGDTYLIGETTVTFTATDVEGNTATCQVIVTVEDNENPTLNCPNGLDTECSINELPPYSSYLAFTNDGGSADDNCAIDTSTFTLDSEVSVGSCPTVVTREYSIEDISGNTATCTQTITINDTTNPTITCPGDIIVSNDTGECNADVSLVLTILDDNCGIDTIYNTYTGAGADASANYPLGTTEVTFTVIDSCDNMVECTTMVTVNDDESPIIGFNDDPASLDTVRMPMCDLAEADTLMNLMEALDAGVFVSDNCGLDSITFTFLEDVLVMGSDPATYQRLFEIADTVGNLDTLVQIIIVEDMGVPVITAPADITVECGDDISDLDMTGQPDAMDNCTADPVPTSYVDVAEVLSCQNDTLIRRIFTATDDTGNTAVDTQLIFKLDTIAPVFNPNPSLFADVQLVAEDSIACNDDFPAPVDAIAVDNCGGMTVVVDTLPFLVNNCTGYKVDYRYIALDNCLNADTVYSSFFVNRDTVAPVVTVLDTVINLFTDINSCEATATLPIPVVIDNCSEFTIANSIDGQDTLTSTFSLDTSMVSYTITDDCGNMTVVDQMVVVQDNQGPDLTCRTTPIQVALSTDESIVLANSFILDATDNCSDVEILVRKVNDLCGLPGNSMFNDTLIFCCEDIGTIQEVEVIATDAFGNQNSCIALAEVSDNLAPMPMIPLPDITLSCDFPLDLDDLSQFGTFVLAGAPREDIIVNDSAYVSTDGYVGQDGVYNDNCPSENTITTNVIDMTTNGTGTIFRIFTITDQSGNEATVTQNIFVQDFNPFSEDDITWPEDITIDGCASDIPTPAEGGVPTFVNVNKCHNIQFNSSDLVFDNPTSGCIYVRRTFKVIDANIYDPGSNPDEGIWTQIQDIFMTNDVAPTFAEGVCSDTLVCAQASGCSALVELTATATDDCTDPTDLEYSYTIDTDGDGNADISGEGNSISQMFDQGTYFVTWSVDDQCGNVQTCTQEVEVKECKLPTPICVALAIDLGSDDGTAAIWASDFDAGSFDNCTDDDDLIFSFSTDPADFGRTYNCDSIGIRTVDLWVTDEAGNQAYCQTTIDVQDNTNYCNDGLQNDESSTVMGYVATQQNVALPNTTIVIEGPEMNKGIMTADDGGYVFNEVPMGNEYSLVPHKDDEHMKGVSTLDLVLIQRHILAMDMLDTPYDIIAADVNGSERVSSADIVELRKLILGVQTTFSQNESFRFVPSDFVFADEEDPFPFADVKDLDELESEMIQTDFIAIKIGDVNGSLSDGLANNEVETRSDDEMMLYTEDQALVAGELVIVPLYTDFDQSLVGIQYTIDYDDQYLEFVSSEGGQLAIENAHVADHGSKYSKTTVAWTSAESSEPLNNSEPLAYFAYRVKQNGTLSRVLSINSDITKAMAYDADHVKYNISMRYDRQADASFAVFQNRPNPFTEYTEIYFDLPKSSDVSLHVFDAEGKMVYRQADNYAKGSHRIRLNAEQLTKTGIYYYKIKAGDQSEIRKMLKIQ